MLGIVVSKADEASTHIHERLLEGADWAEDHDDGRPAADGGGTVHRLADAEVRTFDALHLELDGVADAFEDPSLLAVASRHSGDTGPLLTAHHTGNFGQAEFGGRDGELARAAPNAHRAAIEALASHAPDGYEVGMECTHHGPSAVGAPSLFVEVGSGPDQWADPAAAAAVARAILDLRDVAADAPREDGTRRHLVGFGDGHYAPRFERIVRETDWAVGHVAADWALDAMDDYAGETAVIEQAFVQSNADRALVSDPYPDLEATIADLGYRTVGETWVRETSGVSLELVADLEAEIGAIEDGLRFGARAETAAGDSAQGVSDTGASGDADFVVGTIPASLCAEATGIDQEATMATVDSLALAYDTTQGASVVGGPVALRRREDGEALIEGLADVLATKYDEVDRDDGEIVATTEQFDPGLAREAGVSPGPDFGRLAEGEPVTVDGEPVRPADVTETIERRFPGSLTWA